MSYPPQQPENGWSDQEPVDPFAPGNAAPPAAPQADAYGQQPPQQPDPGQQYPYQAQPPVYHPGQPQQPGYPPSDQTQALPPRGPDDAYQQQYYPPADPNAQQYYQAPDPNAPAQPGYPQAQPLPDPFATQQPQSFPQAPVSASPTSAQPASGQPFSGQPYQAATPPGVPESPFAANLPTPVSASPTSGQPWGAAPAPAVPQFVPRKPRRGLPGWLYVVGVIVFVAALAVGGVVWFGGDAGGDPSAGKSQSQESSKAEPSPKKEKATLVTDEESGLAFQSLPEPWKPVEELDLPGASSTTGQTLDSDKGVPGYFVVSQLKTSSVDYADNDVVEAGKSWSSLIDKSHWVDGKGKKLKGVDRTAPPKFHHFRVDGHNAYYMTYKVTWKSDKVDEKGAVVTIGVIDQDGKTAAGFLAILPSSLAEQHESAVKDTMLTLRFEE